MEKAKENIYFCFIDCTKAFDCMGHNKLWKILKAMGIPDHLTCLLETHMPVKKQQLEPDKQQTGSKLGKDYIKAVYCHSACLTYYCKMPYWMKHKLQSRFLGVISITSDNMQMTALLWQKLKRNKRTS